MTPHHIYDADELAMDFVKEVGKAPCWPAHTATRAQLDVSQRNGPGAWVDTSQPLARVAYGWEIAESLVKAMGIQDTPDANASLEDRYTNAVFTLEEHGY